MGKQINFFAAREDLHVIFEALSSCFGNVYVALRRGSDQDVKARPLDFATFEALTSRSEEWILASQEVAERFEAKAVWHNKAIFCITDQAGMLAYTPPRTNKKMGTATIGRLYVSVVDDEMNGLFQKLVKKLKRTSIKFNDGMVFLIFPGVAEFPTLEFWEGIKAANPLLKKMKPDTN